MILRCTGKVRALLREPVLLIDDPSNDDWYANVVWVDRRKCLLLTHAGTLFSVFVPNVTARDLRPIGRFVVFVVERALRDEGLRANVFGDYDSEPRRQSRLRATAKAA